MSREHDDSSPTERRGVRRRTVLDRRVDDAMEQEAGDGGIGDGAPPSATDGSSYSRRGAIRAGLGCLTGVGVSGASLSTLDRAGGSVAARRSDDSPTAASPNESGPPDTSEMELIVEDQFRTGALDTAKWSDKYPWDARTHNYDGYAAPENVYVEDGSLVLKATNQPREDRTYSTGVVSATEVFEPGYFEASIKVPPHRPGFWPAFWLTSASYHPPEIDIFEFFGTDPRAHMTYHFANSEGREEKVRERWGNGFADGFHTYSVDWEPPERIVWYIDGVERFRYDGEYVSDEFCYLILNFGIDRPGDPPPRPKDLPATYEVEWIRCWER